MIEYKILRSFDYIKLAKDIEDRLNNGWKLAGDLRVAAIEGEAEFYQALTKGNPNA